MNRETFSLQEQNILLRNKQKKAEMMRLMEQERRRQLKAENQSSKKVVSKDKKTLEKTIDIKKVNNIKKQLKQKNKQKSNYLLKSKPRSIFSLNIAKKPSKKYTREQIIRNLDGYIEIENIDRVPPNTYIKYITFKNGRQQYMKGGILKYNQESTITLSNAFGNNKSPIYWPVKKEFRDEVGNLLFRTIFFRKALYEETKMRKELNQCENIIAEQNDMIEQLQRELIKYKKYIKMLKKNME